MPAIDKNDPFATPAERELLAKMAAAEEAGTDPFEAMASETLDEVDTDEVIDDGEVPDPSTLTGGANFKADAGKTDDAKTGDDGAADDEGGIDVKAAKADDKPADDKAKEPEAKTDEEDDDEPGPLTVDKHDYDAERKALREQRKELRRQHETGELDDDDYDTKIDDLEDRLESLTLKQAESKADERAQLRATKHYQDRVITGVMKEAKGQGIDYVTDAEASVIFDSVMGAKLSKGGLSFKAAAAAAHKAVLASKGIVAAAAKKDETKADVKKDEAKKPERKAPDAPLTLRTLPAAAPNNPGSSLRETWASLKGAKADAFWERLTSAQKELLMSPEAV